MPRPLLECRGGPLCGDWLFLPEGEPKVVVVPARSAGVRIGWVRMLVGMGCPGVRRVGTYKAARCWRTGDPVFAWQGEC